MNTKLWPKKLDHYRLMYMPFSTRVRGYAINYRDTKNADELELAKKIAIQSQEKAQLNSELTSYIKAIDHHALVSVTDSMGIIIQVNDRFSEISGYSKQELLGQNHRTINSGTHPKAFFTELWTTISSGNTWSGEVCNRTKKGKLYWVDSTIVPIKDTDGSIKRFISVRLDITESKKAEQEIIKAKEEAVQANHAKSDFLSSMSHELRTPLNAVMGFAQLIEMEAEDEVIKDNSHEILVAGKHLLQLISQVLDLSKIESGNMDISIKNHNFNEIFKGVMSLIQPIADKSGIQICNNVSPSSDTSINVDETKYKQVLLNVLSNAIKYNSENGKVTIDSSLNDDNMFTLSIADSGKGLTPEQQIKTFLPFDRAGAEGSNIEGAGLGLAISKKLIEQMDGTITVESEVGKGSCFLIQVPLS